MEGVGLAPLGPAWQVGEAGKPGREISRSLTHVEGSPEAKAGGSETSILILSALASTRQRRPGRGQAGAGKLKRKGDLEEWEQSPSP